jgi:hypothetical protein
MHRDLALQYELRWLSRFGLNYYGCCEPLHCKLSILENIPNLRKDSMSPFIYVDEAVANMSDRYVFSYKPNPAMLAGDKRDLDKASCDMEEVFSKARSHCLAEAIMKGISTLRYQPQRVWKWAHMASDLSRQHSS